MVTTTHQVDNGIFRDYTDKAAHAFANAKTAAAVAPSDTTVLDFNALYIGVSGDVSIELEDTTSVVFVGVPSGSILPVQGIGVDATNTTAASIVWLKW